MSMQLMGERAFIVCASRFIALIYVLLAVLRSSSSIHAAELPTEPILRIEVGMHLAEISGMGLSADNKTLVTGSLDKTVRLWSIPDGSLLRTLRVPIDSGVGGKIQAIALSPDGVIAAVSSWENRDGLAIAGHLYIFDMATGNILREVGPFSNNIVALRFSPDGKYLVARKSSNGLYILDSKSWETIGGDPLLENAATNGLSFSTDGKLAVTTFWGNEASVVVYPAFPDLNSRIVSKTQKGKKPAGVAFSPDGNSVAVGYRDIPGFDVLKSDTLELRRHVSTGGDYGDLPRVAWSRGGENLFAAGNRLHAWTNAGKGKHRILAQTEGVTDLISFGENGVVYSSADPAFGVIGDDGHSVLAKEPVTVDMRMKRWSWFTTSDKTSRIRFGVKNGGDDPWLFNIDSLTFTKSQNAPSGLHEADEISLAVTDWFNSYTPKLDGQRIGLFEGEYSKSLSVFPKKTGILLGTNLNLWSFRPSGSDNWHVQVPATILGTNLSSDGGIAVTALEDGTFRWYRTSDGQQLLSLFVHVPDKRWVLWTPTGYYAASPGGEDLIGWHVNRGLDRAPDFFPASRFREKFNRPDIVQLMLETLDEGKAVKLANEKANLKEAPALKDLLPPVVNILSPGLGSNFTKREVTIEYSLRSPSGLPVDRVEVLIDGRPTRGLEPVEALNGLDPKDELKGQITVTLPARNVEVGLIARSGSTASDVSIVRLIWKGTAPSGDDLAKPRLFALVVGVSSFERSELNLKYAAKDASDFAAAMTAQQGGQYSNVEVKLLTDGTANREAIEEGLAWLEKSVASTDVGVLFMAGHGKTDEKLRYHFIAYDTDPTKLKSTAVSRESIRDTLGAIAGPVIAFLDTCHAGAVAESGQTRGDVDSDRIVNELSGTDRNAIVFASSTGRELSLEDDNWSNGAFTKALIEGLGTTGKPAPADYTKDGKITTAELGLYITDKVKILTGDSQHPVLSHPPTVPEIFVASAR